MSRCHLRRVGHRFGFLPGQFVRRRQIRRTAKRRPNRGALSKIDYFPLVMSNALRSFDPQTPVRQTNDIFGVTALDGSDRRMPVMSCASVIGIASSSSQVGGFVGLRLTSCGLLRSKSTSALYAQETPSRHICAALKVCCWLFDEVGQRSSSRRSFLMLSIAGEWSGQRPQPYDPLRRCELSAKAVI